MNVEKFKGASYCVEKPPLYSELHEKHWLSGRFLLVNGKNPFVPALRYQCTNSATDNTVFKAHRTHGCTDGAECV